MKKCRITVIRKIEYADLMEKYENPIENTCTMKEGQIFVTNGWKQPEGFCQSAWDTLSPFVMALLLLCFPAMTVFVQSVFMWKQWKKRQNRLSYNCASGKK